MSNKQLRKGQLVNSLNGVYGVILDIREGGGMPVFTPEHKGIEVETGRRIPLTGAQAKALRHYADKQPHTFDHTTARPINALVTLKLLRYVSGCQAELTAFGVVYLAAQP